MANPILPPCLDSPESKQIDSPYKQEAESPSVPPYPVLPYLSVTPQTAHVALCALRYMTQGESMPYSAQAIQQALTELKLLGGWGQGLL